MSVKSGTNRTTIQHVSVVAPSQLLAQLSQEWLTIHRKSMVRPSAVADNVSRPLAILAQPQWPGTGTVSVETDSVPLVVIPGMPASMYPAYTSALIGYTLADMCVARPYLAISRGRASLVHMVTMTVIARVGAWAAVGRAPDAAPTVTSEAVRWSIRNNALVVRAAQPDDGTALWRHFLATMPAQLEGTREAAACLAGLGPLLFLLGGNLCMGTGETYASHFVESAMYDHARANLSRSTYASLRVAEQATWDTMYAAAVGGYRVSVVRSLGSDAAFVTGAQLRVSNDRASAVAMRLDRLLAGTETTHAGVSPGRSAPVLSGSRPAQTHEDDSASVADTEDFEMDEEPAKLDRMQEFLTGIGKAAAPNQVGGSESGHTITPPDAAAIRAQAQVMREQAPKAPSEFQGANAAATEAVKW
jgi:hypothetical protein